MEHAVSIFQVAADLVIIQDDVVIRDAIVPMGNGEYQYYEGITYKCFKGFEQKVNVVHLYFAWGSPPLERGIDRCLRGIPAVVNLLLLPMPLAVLPSAATRIGAHL